MRTGAVITGSSSFNPRLSFTYSFIRIEWYYRIGSQLGYCPSRGSDPDARNGHAIANRVCLPVPALGHKER